METGQAKFGSIQIGIILLTLATAGIHFSLVFPSVMFILNALGYLALLAAYFLPLPFVKENRDLVRWIFIGFTAVTILGWVAIGDKGVTLGYITKAIEVVLIALLWFDGRR
ncbi:MAG: hypothetical protein PVG14_04760 [Anaerolineales bacterium]|jgi:hypothetical protein